MVLHYSWIYLPPNLLSLVAWLIIAVWSCAWCRLCSIKTYSSQVNINSKWMLQVNNEVLSPSLPLFLSHTHMLTPRSSSHPNSSGWALRLLPKLRRCVCVSEWEVSLPLGRQGGQHHWEGQGECAEWLLPWMCSQLWSNLCQAIPSPLSLTSLSLSLSHTHTHTHTHTLSRVQMWWCAFSTRKS